MSDLWDFLIPAIFWTLVVVAVVAAVCCCFGLFARTTDVYLNTRGLNIMSGNSNTEFGHVITVVENRRPGPDRLLAIFDDEDEALLFASKYRNLLLKESK